MRKQTDFKSNLLKDLILLILIYYVKCSFMLRFIVKLLLEIIALAYL